MGKSARARAAIALILLIVLASGGLLARFYLGSVGRTLFVMTRLGMLLLPVLWHRQLQPRSWQFGWPAQRQFWDGNGLGLILFSVIVGSYWAFGRTLIDEAAVQASVANLGLLQPFAYFAFAVYFTFINACVEEYIWRWFAYRACEQLVTRFAAVGLAAVSFTLHHIVALAGFTGNLGVIVIGSLGVFIAGAIWSGCYLRYRSLWPCYISHAWADLAIAIVGWHLLFIA
ncbi:MAG: lysostaphin resistance A-like protein [Leptolyngbyaceae cyanobacterium]